MIDDVPWWALVGLALAALLLFVLVVRTFRSRSAGEGQDGGIASRDRSGIGDPPKRDHLG
jgi:hypothetical protein